MRAPSRDSRRESSREKTGPGAPRRRVELAVPILLVLLAGGLYFVRLGVPGEIVGLDEKHYVPEARTFVDSRIAPAPTPHPPLGKWFMAGGIALFGDSPVGWRFGSALLGTFGVLFTYLIGRRLWKARGVAALGAFLLTIDGLWFVQSRIAMLDIYAASFMVAGVWLLIEDRARSDPGFEGVRWWRVGSGIAFGLAIASKLSVVLYLLVTMVLALAWELQRLERDPRFILLRRKRARRQTGEIRRIERLFARAVLRQCLAIAGTFILLPLFLYVASYGPNLARPKTYALGPCQQLTASPLAAWSCQQRVITGWNGTVPKADQAGRLANRNLGEAWSWPWIGHPVSHFSSEEESPAVTRSVLGLPNPLVWWPAFLVAFPLLGWWGIRERDVTSLTLFALIALGFVPYLLAGAAGHAVYSYYATPLVPWLVLGLAHAFHRVTGFYRYAWRMIMTHVLLALSAFAFFYPVLAAVPMPAEGSMGREARMWMSLDCSNSGITNFCWRV